MVPVLTVPVLKVLVLKVPRSLFCYSFVAGSFYLLLTTAIRPPMIAQNLVGIPKSVLGTAHEIPWLCRDSTPSSYAGSWPTSCGR